MAETSVASVVFIVILSLVVVFLGLVCGKFWHQNRSLKRRIDYYIGVLDLVKRYVDFAIFSDPTTELQESHQSEEQTDSQTPGTPGDEGVQAKTMRPLSEGPDEYEGLELANVSPQRPSVPQQSEGGRREEGVNEYSVLSVTSPRGIETLCRASSYLEMTLQDPSLYSSDSSPYTPLVWLKRKRSKQKEREVFGQRIDYRINPVSLPVRTRDMTSPPSAAESASAALGQWGGGGGGDRLGRDLVGGGGGGGGRLPGVTGKHFHGKWQQRQSAMISDELMTNFRIKANAQDRDQYDICTGTSQQPQQQQQQQPKANYAAANRGHGVRGGGGGGGGGGGEGKLRDIGENAKLKDSCLNIQPPIEHRRHHRHPASSSESHQLTEPRKGIRGEEETDLSADKKKKKKKTSDDGTSAQDTGAKYVNINYIEREKQKKAKSSKYTNLPF